MSKSSDSPTLSNGSAPQPYASGFPPESAVGVLRPDDSVEWVFDVGESVPAPRRRVECRTSAAVKAGAAGEALRFPIVRGSGRVRHSVIGAAVVRADELSADLPAGSRLTLGIRLDESHNPSVSIFIPSSGDIVEDALELGFKAAFPEGRPTPPETPVGDVPPGAQMLGTPAESRELAGRQLVAMRKLPGLVTSIRAIKKKLDQLCEAMGIEKTSEDN